MSNIRIPDTRGFTASGRLGRDPELRYPASGTTVIQFSVAIRCPRGKDKEAETWWLDCKSFGKAADTLAQLGLAKGDPIMAEGVLDQECWTAKDGQERRKVVLLVNRVQRLEWPDDGQPQDRPKRTSAVAEPVTPEDDIPF